MKLIDAHSHIGNFGSWARFDFDLSRLKAQMAQFNIEKTLLTGANAHDNDAVLHAFKAAPDLIVPVAWVTPADTGVLDEIRLRIGQGFRGKEIQGLGIGNCCRGAARNVPGCPPTAESIARLLRP